MTSRFNPIKILGRRSSKLKKPRSESADQTSLDFSDGDHELDEPTPRIRTRPAKKTSMTSDSIRAYVLASIRRARSPRRKSKHQKTDDYIPRATSVPRDEGPNPNGVHKPHGDTNDRPNSPAPLAQGDMFELTDVSDMEHDQSTCSKFVHNVVVGRHVEKMTNSSCVVDDLDGNRLGRLDGQSQLLETDYCADNGDGNVDHYGESGDTEKQVSSEDELTDVENYNVHSYVFDNDDETDNVEKLSVDYETEYPLVRQDSVDSQVVDGNNLKNQYSDFYNVEEDENTLCSLSCSTVDSEEHISADDDDECEMNDDATHEVETGDATHEVETGDASQECESYWHQTDDNMDSSKNDNDESTEYHTSSYFATNFDSGLGLFGTTKYNTPASWNNDYLDTPSIIVTSASTESLQKTMDDCCDSVPHRPPPPSVPKPPARPASPHVPQVPPKPAPPRPVEPKVAGESSQKSQEAKPKKKRDKLFGIVDLGPLPSDPDPNFPFRSHFEKRLVPNPKKAFQRILRGETKAERLKRKEQAELAKLLKSDPSASDKSQSEQKPESSEWKEFHALTSRIESTVQQSTNFIKSLEPLKSDDQVENENWANFDQPFDQSKPSTDLNDPFANFEPTVNLESFADFDKGFVIEPLVDLSEPVQQDLDSSKNKHFEPDWSTAFPDQNSNLNQDDFIVEVDNQLKLVDSKLDSRELDDFFGLDDEDLGHTDDNCEDCSEEKQTLTFPIQIDQGFDNFFQSEYRSEQDIDKANVDEYSNLDHCNNPEVDSSLKTSNQTETEFDEFFQLKNTIQSQLDNPDLIVPVEKDQDTDFCSKKLSSNYRINCSQVGSESTTSDYLDQNFDSQKVVNDQEEIETFNFDLQPQTESEFEPINPPDDSVSCSQSKIDTCLIESTFIPSTLTDIKQFPTLCQEQQSNSDYETNIIVEPETEYQSNQKLEEFFLLENKLDSSRTETNLENTQFELFDLETQYQDHDITNQNNNLVIKPHTEINQNIDERFYSDQKNDDYLTEFEPNPNSLDNTSAFSNTDTNPIAYTIIRNESESNSIAIPKNSQSIDILENSSLRFNSADIMDSEYNEPTKYTSDISEENQVQPSVENTAQSDIEDNSNVSVHTSESSKSDDNLSTEKYVSSSDDEVASDVHQASDNDYNDDENKLYESDDQRDSVDEQNGFDNDAIQVKSIESYKMNFTDEDLKKAAIPRAKPVRQETLSGNNPFRKQSELSNADELVKAVCAIELNVATKYKSKDDSFESDLDQPDDYSISQDANLNKPDSPDLEKTKTIDTDELGKFDPLQTIYPESDNELVVAENKKGEAMDSTSVDDTAVVQPINLLTDQTVPEGWVNFCIQDQTDAEIGNETFEWPSTDPMPKPVPVEPEPPRPDTPDSDLEIPFHPPADPNDTWRLWMRFPEKKTRVKQMSKYTTDRYWKEVGVRLYEEHGRKVIGIHDIDENTNELASEPYRTVRIEPYMQLSREKLQQYDKYGKLHVFKLNHVSYKEMIGIRPEKFSIKNLQNLVSHKPKQNVALDHLPVYTEIFKFGSLDQSKIRKLMPIFDDILMQIPSHKDVSLNYSREEVCCYVTDEYSAKVNQNGIIKDQKAQTRVFCTAFVNEGPHLVLGLNDKWRYGREIVRRSDILPVMHDEWISIRKPVFHSCVEMDSYEVDHMLKFYPLDGCRFELLRCRVSLRGHREMPMQVQTTYSIDGRRVQMRCDLLVPGFFSACARKGAVPCENVEIHIPVPEDWIYHFRVEKHHKYGSVHSTLRKPGKIKGLERITQIAQSLLPPSILEASIGVAKYEHLYKAIVWRIPRVPDKSEASFRPHLLSCKLLLAEHDTVPEWESLVRQCQVEYTMPSSTISGMTVRSISVEHTGVAEKFVKYVSKYKYSVDINYQLGTRKEPALKGVLEDTDQPDSDTDEQEKVDEPNEYETKNETDEVQSEEKQSEPVFGDLLGLGTGFECPAQEDG